MSLYYKVSPLSSNNLQPAIIFLHGRGSDENDLLGLTSYLNSNFIFASVQAPFKYGFGGYTWFNLDDTINLNLNLNLNIKKVIDSRNMFYDFLNDFKKQYPVDANRIILFGFSMGAMMSLIIALSNPKIFKGVIAHSGMLINHVDLKYDYENLENISFCVQHGKYDDIVPVEFGRNTHIELKKHTNNVVYNEYDIQHNISEESLIDINNWLVKFL